MPVPHGDIIDDYHAIQIKSERETTQHLTKDYKKFGLKSDSFYRKLGVDEYCVRALDLERSGLILGSLVENLKVLSALGFESTQVLTCRDETPYQLVKDILDCNSAKLRTRIWRLNLIAIISAITFFSAKILSFLARTILFANVKKANQVTTGHIAVEFVDPSCSSGRATEPNFLSQIGIDGDKLVAYVRSSQAARNGPKKNFVLPQPIPIVFLDELPLSAHCLKIFLLSGMSLLGNVIHNRCSFRRFVFDLRDLINWAEFTSFLGIYRPSVHVYNTIPNGKANTRVDSGIYTGACRNAKCLSLSYQSRLQYRHKLYYYFKVFDKFYYWGSAWGKTYSYPQFIRDSVYLGYLGENLDYQICRTSENPTNQITVFLSDIDTEHPLHYTLNYTIKFLTQVFEAVSNFNKNSMKKFTILLKPKDPGHWKMLLDSGLLADSLDDKYLDVIPRLDARHSITDSLVTADKVISIGFTTPGIDALAMGIPSIYFTPYKGIYNDIFDDPESPIVATDSHTLIRFLNGDLHIDEDFRCSIIGEEPARSRQLLKHELKEMIS
ncbi:MAG: hypothetical protein VXY91_02360 [Bacteroidota bacterium]|nr:hypothetical protein [Bacteroidota bacterium]